jgi:hypothetical protein
MDRVAVAKDAENAIANEEQPREAIRFDFK